MLRVCCLTGTSLLPRPLRRDGSAGGRGFSSFRRRLKVSRPAVAAVVEYAIYYDYDIQHLYDLEHVWVYIGSDGEVADVEASFHGKYLKGLVRGRTNLSGTRASLYVQPGKHALHRCLRCLSCCRALPAVRRRKRGLTD